MWSSIFPIRFLFVSLSLMTIQGPAIATGQQTIRFVHPIATDTFPPEKYPSATGTGQQQQQQQPEEEDLTSPPSEPVIVLQQTSPPQFQVPVTLPFVMQRPQMKPASYLRPLIMIDPITQDDSQPPIRQTKPWFLPAEEDLTSAPIPGVPLTLPFRNKPISYLRPAILTDDGVSNDESAEDVQPIRATKPFYYFPSRNVAVTLPFDLRQETKNPSKSKPLSYLRPVVTDAVANMQQTPEADDTYSLHQLPPAEEDLTSPIRTQPPKAVAMTIPFIEQPVKSTKPISYLRPWLVDDLAVGGIKPWMRKEVQQDDSVPQLMETSNQRPVPWLAGTPIAIRPNYRPVLVKNGYYFSDEFHQQPAGVWQSEPLIGTILPADDDRQQRPLKPMNQLRPWIVENYYNQPQMIRKTVNYVQPIRQIKPWFAPLISQQSAIEPIRMMVMSENVPTRYQLVKPLIAGPENAYYRRPMKQQKPLISTTPNIQSSMTAATGQAEARVPFLGNWANGNNPGKTQVVGNNTLVYSKQNLLQTGTSTVYISTVFTATTTIVNAYCFSSAGPAGPLLTSTPWCSFRRKRSDTEEEDQSAILSVNGETIQPSQVQKILMTAMPSLKDCNQEVNDPIASSMVIPSIADVRAISRGENKAEGRFLNAVTIGRPTTTVTVTALTVVTEIAITGTTAVTFLGGSCVPRCLQNLPICAV